MINNLIKSTMEKWSATSAVKKAVFIQKKCPQLRADIKDCSRGAIIDFLFDQPH